MIHSSLFEFTQKSFSRALPTDSTFLFAAYYTTPFPDLPGVKSVTSLQFNFQRYRFALPLPCYGKTPHKSSRKLQPSRYLFTPCPSSALRLHPNSPFVKKFFWPISGWGSPTGNGAREARRGVSARGLKRQVYAQDDALEPLGIQWRALTLGNHDPERLRLFSSRTSELVKKCFWDVTQPPSAVPVFSQVFTWC